MRSFLLLVLLLQGPFAFAQPPYTPEQIAEIKIFQRKACNPGAFDNGGRKKGILSPPRDNDRPEKLLGYTDYLNNLQGMEDQSLLAATLTKRPWSGDYWPIAKGSIASRVFDPQYFALGTWKAHSDYISANPVLNIFNSGDPNQIKRLSLAEKYDLLVSPDNRALTNRVWNEGRQYYDRDGKVEGWMGICHGWAPASYMVKRPANSVTVKAFDGVTDIKFHPDEIKGLVTYQWANSPFGTRFIGGRCSTKKPERNDNGRLIDPDCQDSNPATWHAVVVNKLGIEKESFVIDATFDYQVWNQPVFSYSYSYFNPETEVRFATLKEAQISIEEYESDRFKEYRSPQARKVVGIIMTILYAGEARPSMRDHDNGDRDVKTRVSYLYDLEMDYDGNLVGGEWHQGKHPDFMWTADPGSNPLSPLDNYLDPNNWDGQSVLPQRWKEAAQMSSQRFGLVLGYIVNKITALSQEN